VGPELARCVHRISRKRIQFLKNLDENFEKGFERDLMDF
jgi:hypothetical protein